MKKKNLQKIAKTLFKKSLTDGTVNVKKVQLVLKETVARKPPQLVSILKIYKKLIENTLLEEQVVVETALKLANQKKIEKEILNKTGAKKIIYKTNPKIVLGAKITHGDWVWDATLGAKLAQLLHG